MSWGKLWEFFLQFSTKPKRNKCNRIFIQSDREALACEETGKCSVQLDTGWRANDMGFLWFLFCLFSQSWTQGEAQGDPSVWADKEVSWMRALIEYLDLFREMTCNHPLPRSGQRNRARHPSSWSSWQLPKSCFAQLSHLVHANSVLWDGVWEVATLSPGPWTWAQSINDETWGIWTVLTKTSSNTAQEICRIIPQSS